MNDGKRVWHGIQVLYQKIFLSYSRIFLVDNSTIVQIYPSLDTTTSEIVAMAQEEVDIYSGLEMDTGGHISP